MSSARREQEAERDQAAAPGTSTTTASSQTRNCGETTLPNATNATTAAAAYRAKRAALSVSPRANRTQTSDERGDADEPSSAADATAATVPVRFCEP